MNIRPCRLIQIPITYGIKYLTKRQKFDKLSKDINEVQAHIKKALVSIFLLSKRQMK